MKLVDPKVEYWKQGYTLPEIWEHIARCTRVCYQSEKKNLEESEEDFVRRIILKNHTAKEIASNSELRESLHLSVLEHGTVYLKVNEYDNCFSYVNSSFNRVVFDDGIYYITTNMRFIIEHNLVKDLQYICEPTKFHAKRYTCSLTTNVGSIRDTNRHRVHSISEESTRYCLYTKDKFGSEITCTKLPWISDEEYNESEFYPDDLFTNKVINEQDTSFWNAVDWYMWYIQIGEYVYNNLNRLGWKAQQCSEILTFVDDWKHYIHLRSDECSGKVRPEVKVIADKIKEIINKEENTEKVGKEA